MKTAQVLLTFFLAVQVPALACEEHANMKKASKDLPGESLYQLDTQWVNENNKTLKLSHLAGRPRLVAMVYTKCQTACPLLVQDLKSILNAVPESVRKDIHIELFSFESKTETSKTLQGFKSKYSLNDQWSAYAGSESSVAELAAALGVQYKKLPNGEYIHSNVIYFLDKNGEVVAKHEGLGTEKDAFVSKIKSAL